MGCKGGLLLSDQEGTHKYHEKKFKGCVKNKNLKVQTVKDVRKKSRRHVREFDG